MEKHEKIYIRRMTCESVPDDYEHGEALGGVSSYWDSRDVALDRSVPYDSVDDALGAVCAANGFEFKKTAWENFGIESGDAEEEFSRFDTSVYVDGENSEVTDENAFAEWRAGKKKLWTCHVTVELEIKAGRGLTESEVKAWKAGSL